MISCDRCQAQLLERVYGLLDDEDRQEVEQHLVGCEPCRKALAKAEDHQRQLALAAKLEFAGLRFEAPRADVGSVDHQPTLVGGGGFRWAAVAAGILLAIGGLGIPAGIYSSQSDRLAQARSSLERIRQDEQKFQETYRAKITEVDKELQDITQEINALEPAREQKLEQAWTEISNKHLRMTITGPKTPEPGAENQYRIDTQTISNQPAPANLSVKVIDNRQNVVYAVDNVASQGNYQLSLPRSLKLKPNDQLTLEVCATGANGVREKLNETLQLVAPLYRTHLTTDKPMYQPGEVVHFRSLTLERFSLKPTEENLQPIFNLTLPNKQSIGQLTGASTISDGKAILLGPDKNPIRGIAAGEFSLSPDAVGGEYTLSVTEAQNRFPEQKRKFIVNRYEKPRLNKEIHFARGSYGPGESVTATCKAARVEGGKAFSGQSVTASIDVDGQKIAPEGTLLTDSLGAVDVRFKLPAKIDRGVASLTVGFQDGGSNETIVRSIPLVLKKMQVEFFPEGGDLVTGVPNRVYFQARTTLGKPADVEGRIIDDQGAVVADVRTLNGAKQLGVNQGMGAFTFTPLAGKKYQLKIDVPEGISEIVGAASAKEGQFLPPVKDDGVVLTVPQGVTSAKEQIRVIVRSAKKNRNLLVGAYCRGRLLAHRRIEAKAGEAAELELTPESSVGGVCRVTVFEEVAKGDKDTELVPRAERLVYRTPAETLRLAIHPDKPNYVPGDKVKLDILATNERNEPAPAVLMVAVVDNRIFKMADEKTFRGMPTHFLLTTEVRQPEDLEYADFLLGKQAKAGQALDLLLGTQGWRRFAEQDPNQFRNRNPEAADRILVVHNQVQFDQKEFERRRELVETVCSAQHDRLTKSCAKATAAKLAVKEESLVVRERLENELSATQENYQVAAANLAAFQDRFEKIRGSILPAFTLVILILGLSCLLAGLARHANMPQALPYLVAATCSIALFGFLTFLDIQPQIDAVAQTFLLQDAPWGQDEPAVAQLDEHAAKDRENEVVGEDKGDFNKLEKAKREAGARRDAAPLPGLVGRGGAVKRPEATRKPQAMMKGLQFNGAQGKDPKSPPADRPAAFGLNEAKKAFVQDDGKRKQVFAAAAAPRINQLELRGLGQDKRAERDGIMRERQLRNNRQEALAALPPFVVREYAHHHSQGADGVRTDFTETLLWQPVVVLPNGKAELSFDLCDSVTSFQVLASGHTLDGRLGSVDGMVESRLPLVIEPKLPIEITAGDKIDLPLSIANNTAKERTVEVRLQAKNLTLLDGKLTSEVVVGADSRTRRVYRLQPTIVEGEANVAFEGRCGDLASDRILRDLKVVPEGFPIVGSRSDVLEKVGLQEIVLAKDRLPGTLRCRVTVYPSTLADLQAGLEALLREPNGCFEQTSTTNYPNLLVLDYLKESGQTKPEIARRAQGLLERGYAKLTSFECIESSKNVRQGYEWFGGTAPAHEALTAYGLMQFRDMARVHDVDKAMLERTRNYLVSRKDGAGGFLKNPRALDTFGRAPNHVTNAYIVWALTEGGKEDDITKELGVLTEQAKSSKNPYLLALVANSLLNRDQTDAGLDLLKKLAELQQKDGHLDATETSITGSQGRDLQIETTSLVLLGWLKAQRHEVFNVNVQSAVRWIGQQRGGYGGFGSTQSTILALKALIAYARANKKTAEEGDLTLFVGNKAVAQKHFPVGAADALVLEVPDADKLLQDGKNEVRVEITGKSVFPYTLTWTYQTLTPPSAEKCGIKLQTKLDRAKVFEGETVRLQATVENVSGKGQGMTLAIIGLPAGLTLPEDMKQLKDLARLKNEGKEQGEISFFELRGREVVLYWRDMAPGKKVEVSLDLICRVPGEYRGPASRAYLYYNADQKCWVEPLKVAITPK